MVVRSSDYLTSMVGQVRCWEAVRPGLLFGPQLPSDSPSLSRSLRLNEKWPSDEAFELALWRDHQHLRHPRGSTARVATWRCLTRSLRATSVLQAVGHGFCD